MQRFSRAVLLFGALVVALASALPASGTSRKGFTVTTVSPSNGQTISGVATWTAAVAGGSARSVAFLVDGVVEWTDYAAPYGYGGDAGQLDTTTLANGSHTLTVKAYPTSGGRSAVSSISVNVSNGAALGVTILSPSNGQAVSGNVKWEAGVTGGTPSQVVFSIDGVAKWTEKYSPYVFNGDGSTLDTTTLTNGTHTLMATASTSTAQASASIAINVSNASSGTSTAPSNTGLPTISGTAQVGQTLTASPGTWSGSTPMSYAYQWRRCDSAGQNCTSVSGATTASYAATSSDAGSTLRVSVTATDSAGSATASSSATGTVTAPAPSLPSPLGSALPARLPESSGGALYVAVTGSDSNPCALSLPCRSLARAFALASSGATIYVRGGTYAGEQVLRDRQFSPTSPVTVSAYPGETPSFTGDSSASYYGYPAIFIFNVTAVRLRGLAVSNGNGDGVKVENATSVELDRLFVHNNAVMGVYVDGITYGSTQTYSKDVQIWNSTFTMNGGKFPGNEAYASKGTHSIYYGGGPLDGTQHGALGGVIANNVIYDQATGRGIQLGASAWNTIVTNNTINHAYQSGWNDDAGNGIMVFNDGSSYYPTRGIVVVNNIVSNSYGHAVYGSGSLSMTSNNVRNNLGYNNGYGDYRPAYGSIQLYTLGTNLPSADPLYVDAAGHDFRLRSSSPAIGRADPSYAPRTDKSGNLRKSTPDLGAFET